MRADGIEIGFSLNLSARSLWFYFSDPVYLRCHVLVFFCLFLYVELFLGGSEENMPLSNYFVLFLVSKSSCIMMLLNVLIFRPCSFVMSCFILVIFMFVLCVRYPILGRPDWWKDMKSQSPRIEIGAWGISSANQGLQKIPLSFVIFPTLFICDVMFYFGFICLFCVYGGICIQILHRWIRPAS